MRRLLYLALALVLLALTGLALVRVTSSPAYLARVRFEHIREGMSRKQVREMMADVPDVDRFSFHDDDSWRIGDSYLLYVYYELPESDDERDLGGAKVAEKRLYREKPESILDRFLECVGHSQARYN